jgi:hypothetical protein
MKSSNAFALAIFSAAAASALSLGHQPGEKLFDLPSMRSAVVPINHVAVKPHNVGNAIRVKKSVPLVAHKEAAKIAQPKPVTTAAPSAELVVSAQLKDQPTAIKPLTATMQKMALAHPSSSMNCSCCAHMDCADGKTAKAKAKQAASAAAANKIAAAKIDAFHKAQLAQARNRQLAMLRQGRGPLHPEPASKPSIKTLSASAKQAMKQRFINGQAGLYSPTDLISAGVFSYYPLVGGTFRRTSGIHNIVVHSTETGSIADAKMVIRSWNNSGRNHAGAQFIVDRDGKIYETVDPSYGTFHVNSFKTLHDVKNDNSIGIEIVRSGDQQYTPVQFKSVVCLVAYLKNHFQVNQVWGHGQVQPSDRTDPCFFNWTAFHKGVDAIDSSQIASRVSAGKAGSRVN